VEVDDIVYEGRSDPVTLQNIALPWGPDIKLSRVDRGKLSLIGREWDHTGQNGNSARISWSG